MQTIRRIWRESLAGKIALGCGGLVAVVFACLLCSVIAATIAPQQTTTAGTAPMAVVAVALPTPSAVPPTDIPAPTQTAELPTEMPSPVPPTAAPAPTALPTAEPTATPVPTDIPPTPTDDAVATYKAKVGPLVANLGAAMTEVGRLLTKAGDEPTLILDAGWKSQLTTQMAIVQISNNKLINIDPVPGPAQEFHQLLTQAAETCNASMDTLAKGIDSVTPATIQLAGQQMADCNAKVRLASAKIP